MKNNYQDCLTRLLKDEGGYSNNPSDPGGPTNFGITLVDYRKYINPNGTAIDVKNMSVTDAKNIYKPKYWDAVGGDNLPSGVDYTVFDYAVNSGVARAKKVQTKFKSTTDPVKLINLINDERLAFMKALRTWPVFGKGWQRRVDGVRKHSLELAKTPAIQAKPVVPAVATASGSAGAVVLAGSAAVAYAPDQWTMIVPVAAAVALIAVIGVLIYKFNKEA